MIFFSKHKRLLSLTLGICLLALPAIRADQPSLLESAPQETWGSAFNKAINTTILVAPTLFSTYKDASKLSLSNQKGLIGDQPVKPALQKAIRDLMHEQEILHADTIEIVAMRDEKHEAVFDHDALLPTAKVVEIQSTFKHNALGVYATNACIFIDEDIVDFEKNPLLSTFLVKQALRQFKNDGYRKAILAKIALGLAKTAALYKAIPLVTDGMQHLTNAVGWSSFSDSQKNGIVLGTARFAINGIMCPMIAQSIVQKISSQTFSWYQQSMHQPIDETIVTQEEIVPLIVELANIVIAYTNKPALEPLHNHLAGQRLKEGIACIYIDELCTLADKLFTTKSIVTWLEEEIKQQREKNDLVASMLVHLKENFFEKNPNDID